MKSRLALVTIVVSFVALSLAAQSNEIGIAYASSRVDKTTDQDGRVKFDTGSGYALSLNHYWTNYISTELAYATTKADGTISVAGAPVLDIGKLKLKMASFTAQWHFARKAMLDPYAGGGYVAVGTSDLSSNDLLAADIDHIRLRDDSGFIANAGLNVNLSPRWGVDIDGKYFRYRPNALSANTEVGRLDLNPIVVSIGARLRF